MLPQIEAETRANDALDTRIALRASPRYTLPDYVLTWRGRFMQALVNWLHRLGD